MHTWFFHDGMNNSNELYEKYVFVLNIFVRYIYIGVLITFMKYLSIDILIIYMHDIPVYCRINYTYDIPFYMDLLIIFMRYTSL